MTTMGLVVTALLVVETVAVLWLWSQKAVPRVFLRWGRNEPRRTALLVIASHLAWLAGAGCIAILYIQADPAGDARNTWGLAISSLIALLGPYSLVWFARWPGDFRADIDELVAEGASPQTAKAFYCSGAVFAYIAVVVATIPLAACFATTPATNPAQRPPGFASCGKSNEVTVNGADPPPCEVIMRIVAKVANGAAASQGDYLNQNVLGFACNSDRGVAVCYDDDTQFTFEVP